MSKTSKTWLTVDIIAAVIIIDQVLKIWVKTSFYWGEDYEIAGGRFRRRCRLRRR